MARFQAELQELFSFFYARLCPVYTKTNAQIRMCKQRFFNCLGRFEAASFLFFANGGHLPKGKILPQKH